MKGLYIAARYLVAFLIISYGFAKLNGSQFTILDSELDKPMGQVSGFWLTWYFFGYSPFYGNFIAMVQVLGGVLLMFRRTTLLGSCLLFPLVGNIILVDIFYGIDLGALFAALLIMGALLFILAQHLPELIDLFWTKQNRFLPAMQRSGLAVLGKGLVCSMLIIGPAILTYWIANYNNRAPTPLDGAWELIDYSTMDTTAVPSVIFFEYNRAHWCVFKYQPDQYERHHFEVDSAARKIKIWQTWLRKGEIIFSGTYDLSGSRLQLQGFFIDQKSESVLKLVKRPAS